MKSIDIYIPPEFRMTEEEREKILAGDKKCKVCNDLHFIIDDSGNTVRCKCKLEEDILVNMKRSGMNNLLEHKVGNFVATEDWQKQLKNMAISYAKDTENKWFVLLGQSGAGKTMVCSALANKCLSDGEMVNYIQWDLFIRTLKSNMFNNDNMYLEEVKKIQTLYIDDLFKGKISEYDLEICFDIINFRYVNKLRTIVSSEYTFTQLNEIDSAIAGRMYEMCKNYMFEIKKDIKNNYRLK
ncbi:MAG: ATP-binding protein [bacterium]